MAKPATLSFAAAVSFFVFFASFRLPMNMATVEIVGVLGVLAHALLLPLIGALPAPSWARVGGYTWAMGDILLVTARFNTPDLDADFADYATGLRMGLHVCAAIWLLATAIAATGWYRSATAVMGVALGGFSFAAPWVPDSAIYPVMILLVAWLAATGLHMRRSSRGSANARLATLQ